MQRNLLAGSRVPAALSLMLLAATAPAQDMIGVSWTGTTYNIDSSNGTTAVLGSTGFSSNNSMASTGSGTIYVVADQGNTLVTVDATTGNGTSSIGIGLGDVRGLAYDAPSGLLYAIVNTTPGSTTTIDELHTVDPGTGITALVGATGYPGIQGLAFAGGVLYAYDIGAGNGVGDGLLTVNTANGLATDVNPGMGNGGGWQFLTASCDGVLYVGRGELYTVNTTTAVETFVGSMGGADIRGADFKMCGPGGCIGDNYCGPALPNSVNLSATICASGSMSINANNLTVTAADVPPGKFGYFLVSRTQAFFNPPNSVGFICIGADIGRYNAPAEIGMGPTFSLGIDLNNLPTNTPGSQQTMIGETLNFQAWYRDDPMTSNFTDAVNLTFTM